MKFGYKKRMCENYYEVGFSLYGGADYYIEYILSSYFFV